MTRDPLAHPFRPSQVDPALCARCFGPENDPIHAQQERG